jgi:hypothetical protein
METYRNNRVNFFFFAHLQPYLEVPRVVEEADELKPLPTSMLSDSTNFVECFPYFFECFRHSTKKLILIVHVVPYLKL